MFRNICCLFQRFSKNGRIKHQNKNYSMTTTTLNTNDRKLIDEAIIPSKNGNLALVSTSRDIYINLALEQYIAENYDFENRNILLLWQNEPCIVIGRYQNPWLECDLVELKKKNVKLARRASGGGCVYHGMC